MPVQLVHPGGIADLQDEGPIVLGTGVVSLLIEDMPSAVVRLDGRDRPGQATAFGRIVSVDLSRSTGYHHLEVDERHYWFGTEDAKLKLDGIVAMLRYLANAGLGWTGQLVFSDGSYLRDAHVTYGWLDQHADGALAALEVLAAAPRRGHTTKPSSSVRGGERVMLRPTLALLRRRGREFLEPTDDGPVRVGLQTYVPRRIVAAAGTTTLDILANRRAVWLAVRITDLVREIWRELPAPERERAQGWQTRVRRLLQVSPLRDLRAHRTVPLSPQRSTVESIDRNYAVAYDRARDLADLTGWSAGRVRRSAYAYVSYADEIYQAFAVTVMASALGLKPNARALGIRQPAFESDAWAFYYDSEPPPQVMRTWRSLSGRPDGPKPDILLLHRPDSSVVLGDAKYRQAGNRASESSYHDIQAYMSAYGINTAVIVYPAADGQPAIHRVTAEGREVVEISITPHPDMATFAARELPTLVQAIRARPPWAV